MADDRHLHGTISLSPITEGDNGELVRPKAGGAVLLALHPNASAEVETRPEQQVSQALCYEAVITLDMTDRWAASWSRATVLIKISLEDKFVYNDRLRPSTRDKNIVLGPVLLPKDVFAESIGVVRLCVDLSNDNGLTDSLATDPVLVEVLDTEEGRRLRRMFDTLQENADLLLHEEAGTKQPGRQETGERLGNGSLEVRLELVDRIVLAYTTLHRFFETNARFRLKEARTLIDFERLSTIDARTLEFVATHPEELEPSECSFGIQHAGRHYLPKRAPAVQHQRAYDIYENVCLVDFLQTVASALGDIVLSVGNLLPGGGPKTATASSGSTTASLTEGMVRSLIDERHSHAERIEGLLRSYMSIFGLRRPEALAALPKPTAIFISSAPYRRIYDLMLEWFRQPAPSLIRERMLLSVGRSSRLFELHVLGALLRALDPQILSKRRFVHPCAPKRDSGTSLCNEFSFERNGELWTIFYEPVIPSGQLDGENPTGLVRTMSMHFSPAGLPCKLPEQTFWTPDFVLRISDPSGEKGSRYWIGDAKYSTWPTVMREYAQAVLFKYLLATSPADPKDQICGLVLFCGKTQRKEEFQRSMRDALDDQNREREPMLELLTLSADDPAEECKALREWLEREIS